MSHPLLEEFHLLNRVPTYTVEGIRDYLELSEITDRYGPTLPVVDPGLTTTFRSPDGYIGIKPF